MRKWLKAGLIGAAVECVLSLLSMVIYFVPSQLASTISCALCGPTYLLLAAAGGLAGYWVPAPRVRKDGAKAGVKAGLVAGSITAVWGWILSGIAMATGLYDAYLRQAIPPEQMQVFREMNMEFILTPAFAIVTTLCGGLVLVGVGAGLGALGGLIMASPKGGGEPPVQAGSDAGISS